MRACVVYSGKRANRSSELWKDQIDVIVTSFHFAEPLLYKSLSDSKYTQDFEI